MRLISRLFPRTIHRENINLMALQVYCYGVSDVSYRYCILSLEDNNKSLSFHRVVIQKGLPRMVTHIGIDTIRFHKSFHPDII
jgi:hypothetical protein